MSPYSLPLIQAGPVIALWRARIWRTSRDIRAAVWNGPRYPQSPLRTDWTITWPTRLRTQVLWFEVLLWLNLCFWHPPSYKPISVLPIFDSLILIPINIFFFGEALPWETLFKRTRTRTLDVMMLFTIVLHKTIFIWHFQISIIGNRSFSPFENSSTHASCFMFPIFPKM